MVILSNFNSPPEEENNATDITLARLILTEVTVRLPLLTTKTGLVSVYESPIV